jgi:hypothetical protein
MSKIPAQVFNLVSICAIALPMAAKNRRWCTEGPAGEHLCISMANFLETQ